MKTNDTEEVNIGFLARIIRIYRIIHVYERKDNGCTRVLVDCIYSGVW